MFDLLEDMKKELVNLESGEEFLVKDMFKGYEWNRHDINTRRNLGSIFLAYVNSDDCTDIEVLDKNPSNQQVYRKK